MSYEAFLLTLAQLGLAFAGISSILTIFQKKSLNWTLREIIGLVFMIEQSIGLVVCSVTPLFFYYILDSVNKFIELNQWNYSKFELQKASVIFASIILALFNLYQLLKFFSRKRQIDESNDVIAAEKPMLFIFVPVTFLIFSLLLGNTYFGWFGIYALGLGWQLLNGVIQFFVFISLFTKQDMRKIKEQQSLLHLSENAIDGNNTLRHLPKKEDSL